MHSFRLISAAAVAVVSLLISDSGLAQPSAQYFEPRGGRGPGLLLISGQSGPGLYVAVAQQFAAQGFHVALIDGNEMSVPTNAGRPALAAAVSALKSSPKTSPGKIGVVGSSLGGAAALSYAARMPAEVAAVVVYYPVTYYVQNVDTFARQIRVPTLVLAGVQDTYKNCCTIEMARKLKAASPRVQLVEYPQANHGFNLAGPTMRAGDAADALRRAVAHLHRFGLAAKSK